MQHTGEIFIKRNYVLGVVNGALFHLTLALLNPTVVLSVFILHLSGSSKAVGLVTSLMTIGWLWPQIFFSNIMDAAPRKKGAYIFSAVTRIAALIALPTLVFLLGSEHPRALLFSVSGTLFAFSSFGGLGILPFMDIITRSMPYNLRGRFFAARAFFGGILGLAASFFVRYILSERSGLSFPDNYLFIFTAAAIAGTASLVSFCMTVEPPPSSKPRRVNLLHQLRRGPRFMRRDRAFRRYLLARIPMDFAFIASPFYIVYAKQRFGIADQTVATFLAAQVVCSVSASLIWGRIGDRFGNKVLLVLSSAVGIFAPLLALTAGAFAGALPHGKVICFVLVLGFFGLTYGGQAIGKINYLLDIAPVNKRSTYIAFSNAFLSPLTFSPLLGGWVIEKSSFEVVFVIALVSSVASVLMAALMESPLRRIKPRPTIAPVPPLRASPFLSRANQSGKATRQQEG